MKKHIKFSFICLAMALFFGQRARAGSAYLVEVWNTEDQLRFPENTVIALTQTHDGYLWLGTFNGLARFDGSTFTPFNVNNTPGLPDDVIIFLFEDSRTNLWIGTIDGGLCAMQNGSVKNVLNGIGKIVYAEEDASGEVWFCLIDGRVICWRNGQMDFTPSCPPEFWNRLYHRAYNLTIPHKNGGFWRLNVQNTNVEDLSEDGVAKTYGQFPWAKAFAPFTPAARTGFIYDSAVTAANVDQDGNLAVGTRGDGIFWMDGHGGWRHITTGDTTSPNYVLAVCFDRDGNLWAGTDGGGLYRVRKKSYEVKSALPAGVAKSVAEDAAGGLWVTYNTRGLTYLQANLTTHYSVGNKNNAWSVLVDDRQRVWAGTRDEGLFQLQGDQFRPVFDVANIGQIQSLFQTHNGTIWAGGQNGLAGFDGQSWKMYSAADGLPAKAVRALAEGADSSLLIGTDGGGLFVLRDGKIYPVPSPVKDISCLLVDRDGVLWAGTTGHGLARLGAGLWKVYSAADGLAEDDIGCLIEDDYTNLWMGSYEGLTRVEKKSLADFDTGTAKKIFCRTFLTRECSTGAQPAACLTHEGTLLFPTIEGVVSVNPADLRPDTNPPPVVIESVFVDEVPVAGGAVTLRPDNEQLEIHFTALNFSDPKGATTRFRYQLDDQKPTDVGGERVVHFSRLAPGRYVFRVTACNEDGYWNKTGATLLITVEPPFWRKAWFITAIVLFFIGTLAGAIYLISTAKLKRQLRALHQKELIETERARIARDLHDQLGANLTQVTLLGELAEADKDLPSEVEQHAQQICATARETTHALDEIVWAVNPSNDTLEGLANYACKYAQDYFALAGVSYRAELPPNLPPTPILPEVRHNVFLAFKEAVNNVVKHAHATEARVKLQLEAEKFILSVADNGRGLGDVSGKSLRNGMKNMRRRLADVGGEFEIAPGPNGGTVVRLKVPVATE